MLEGVSADGRISQIVW